MNNNKRDILKGLAVCATWATPVVSSVMLPVHADTSQAEPGMEFTKTTVLCSSTDPATCSSCPGAPDRLVASDAATVYYRYCFGITNTGNVDLVNIQIDDPDLPPISFPIETLAPGQTGYAVSLVQTGFSTFRRENTATASAQFMQQSEPPFGDIEEQQSTATIRRQLF